MKDFVQSIIQRYDELIAELERINQLNLEFLDEANKDSEDPEIKKWAEFAQGNLRRLDQLKIEREYFSKKYLN